MSRAALRYAKAVLSLATDKKIADVINSDMQLITKTIADHQELNAMLKNAVVKSEVKKTVLLQVFPDINTLSKELFNMLIANKRIGIVDEVSKKYSELFDLQIGKEQATVITAVPMTSDLELKVLAKIKELTNKAVEVKNVVDESILGGFILRVGDIQYNASIASKLNKLKREFTLN